MVDVAKPDYLSLVNKNGSGFNVSELVEAMVSAEIEPRRTLENDKLKKTETAISGISYLNSQVTKTMNKFKYGGQIEEFEQEKKREELEAKKR